MPRYAIYFAPRPETALAQAGRLWLGRDAETGAEHKRPEVPGLSRARVAELTADARRYGFHATLKPPFHLLPETNVDSLSEATGDLAHSLPAFSGPPLQLRALGGFLALTLVRHSPQMQEVADRTVVALDRFRAPPGAEELARRSQARLSPKEDRLLQQWGYPYVLERFSFHMTLTARLEVAERAAVWPVLQAHFTACIGLPFVMEDLCLFAEPEPRAPFRLTSRHPLTGCVSTADLGRLATRG